MDICEELRELARLMDEEISENRPRVVVPVSFRAAWVEAIGTDRLPEGCVWSERLPVDGDGSAPV